jgi:hypothetical protein
MTQNTGLRCFLFERELLEARIILLTYVLKFRERPMAGLQVSNS